MTGTIAGALFIGVVVVMGLVVRDVTRKHREQPIKRIVHAALIYPNVFCNRYGAPRFLVELGGLTRCRRLAAARGAAVPFVGPWGGFGSEPALEDQALDWSVKIDGDRAVATVEDDPVYGGGRGVLGRATSVHTNGAWRVVGLSWTGSRAGTFGQQ